MLVESRAPAASGATRAAVQPWSAPLLVAGIIPTPSLHESLWSESAERQEERLDGLQEDDERVAGVLEGLAPTNAERVAQSRAVRDEASEASSARAQRRELSRRDPGKSEGAFRSMLDGARAVSVRPPTTTTGVNTRAGSGSGDAAPDTVSTGSITSGIVTAKTEPLTPRPERAQSVAPSAAGPEGTSSQSPASSGAIEQVANANNVNWAAMPVQLSAATAGAATQCTEPAVSAASPSQSGTASASSVTAPGSAEGKAPSDSADGDRPVAERELERAQRDADDRAENVERVLRVLRGSLRREQTTTVIRMDPPELGALRLELDLRKDVLTLRMSAETVAAQDLLRDELDALRRGLEAAGIRLERVEILPLATGQEAPPFGAFGDSGQRRGESSGDSASRLAGQTPSKRAERAATEAQPVPATPAVMALGPARLNIVV